MLRMMLLLFSAAPALAHAGEPHTHAVMSPESFWNLVTGLVLFIIGALYAFGLRRLWRTAGGRSTVKAWHAALFGIGWGTVLIALLSRLDSLSDVLFSAHMLQHEILMLISAPLMVMGRPFVVTLWALSDPQRASVATHFRRPAVRTSWHQLTGPMTVLILHAAVLWIWHVPALFEAALQNEAVHVFQHLGFFLTAALFWWALIHGRFGKVGYGAGVLYVFSTAMHSQILGALLTFGKHPWYPTHARRTGSSWLEDQQLAGLLMWIPFGVVFMLIGLALFAAWIGEAERRVRFTTADQMTGEQASRA